MFGANQTLQGIRRGLRFFVPLMLFSIFIGSGPAAAQSVQEKLDQLNRMPVAQRQKFLEEQAIKEGKVVIYSSGEPDVLRDWNALFKKKYPQIDSQFVRMTTEDLLQKAIHESEAGRPVADVVNPPAAELAIFLSKEMLARYVSPESKDFDSEFKDAAGYWTTGWYVPEIVGFNKDLIKERDVPATLEALASPALRGKLGRTQMGNRWLAGVAKVRGESTAAELAKKIAAQKPRIYNSNTALGNALTSGQIGVAFDIHINNVAKLVKQGAPVGMVVPEPMFVYPQHFAIPKDAPHSYAAALVYDWLISKEGGQSIYMNRDHIGPRKDTEYPYKDMIKQAKTVVSYSPTLLTIDVVTKYTKIFEDLFIRR